MYTRGDQAAAIDYQSRRPARTIGSSPLVRLVAVVLLAIIAHFVRRSRETLGGLADWVLPIGAALAGSVYCVLISLNVAGRTTPGSVSWLRRIGGVGAPIFLISSAVRRVQDVLADPYARRHDVVAWIAAAVAASAVAIVIGYLGCSHWNDTN
jgi:hypothetical protein